MAITQNTTVFMAVDFPPPVHGAAKNNEKLAAILTEHGLSVLRGNTSIGQLSHHRSGLYHVRRFATNLKVSMQLCMSRLRTPGKVMFYHVPNGGQGLYYTLGLCLLARLLRMPIVLHYRTFQYIDNRRLSLALVLKLCDSHVTHVFLSPGMQTRFFFRYPIAVKQRAVVLSNAILNDMPISPTRQRDPTPRMIIGHLSNLCREKGVYDVIKTFEALRGAGISAELWLAGAAASEQVKRDIDRWRRTFGDDLRVLGPVMGNDKLEFFRGIDLFLFPTHYANEAQPNVIFEALAAGVPVATIDRGLIAEMLPAESGGCLLVRRNEDFSAAAVQWIIARQQEFGHPSFWLKANHCIEWKRQLRQDAERQMDDFVGLFTQ